MSFRSWFAGSYPIVEVIALGLILLVVVAPSSSVFSVGSSIALASFFSLRGLHMARSLPEARMLMVGCDNLALGALGALLLFPLSMVAAFLAHCCN
ncbi:hypothetical protein PVK06_042151 [Gossypium arboreum]|uniref:Uncharacterized protein n=1 Tax=Gossypium arboreum TaxID=29729 RepID=A0ABR0MKD2_GOSAR|nr:hypothetical protein PVK06_042151 [Gossypium arboreum]